jgi:Tfp pilus assembly protein PilV
MILEVVIAILILTVALMALASVYAASALSLHRSVQRGTAVTMAESQMEVYRTVSFSGIRLSAPLVSAASSTYVSANTSNSAIPPATGQAVTGLSDGDAGCVGSPPSVPCQPEQSKTGPEGRSYTNDTYIDYVNDDSTLSIVTPASGLMLKLVTVVVRDASTSQVLAIDSSAFHSS